MAKKPNNKHAAPAVEEQPAAQAAAETEQAETEQAETEQAETEQAETEQAETEQAGDEITVYDDLLDAIKAENAAFAMRNAKEDPQTFLKRLLHAASELKTDLRPDTEAWYDAQAVALSEGKPLTEPPGYIDPQPTAAAPKPGKPAPAPKTDKAAKAPKAPPLPRQPGKTQIIREIVVRDPGMSIDDLREALEARGMGGMNASTISTIRTDCLATIKAAKEAGVWGGK